MPHLSDCPRKITLSKEENVMTHKILLIEDEILLREELKILLENAMYSVIAPDTYADAAGRAVSEKADLILLDVNLPGLSGFDLCTQIRSKSDTPVIFLTGRTGSMDELTGILKGADDYITKPFEPAILLARIGAVLKRTGKSSENREAQQFSHRDATLDTAACCLLLQDKKIDLTKTEMRILHKLFLHKETFVPRQDLVDHLWESHIFLDDNTLSVHITRLREKLRSAGLPDFIETKRGMGYRI